MGAAVQTVTRSQSLRSSGLRRPISLRLRECDLVINADASVRYLHSLKEKRALFGFEQIWFYKVQAGVVVHAQRPDWSIRPRPKSVQFSGKIFDGIDASQFMEFHHGGSRGYVRHVRLRNGTASPMHLRAVSVHDPTAAHFRDDPDLWGSLGVNGFNRQSHVALDEVSDPPSARVLGTVPSPSRFYMTTVRSRAQGIVGTGEVPEGTAGMSGQVLIVSVHDLELAPGESKELVLASIYSPGKLEEALAEFGKIQSGEKSQPQGGAQIGCSDPTVGEAASWALACLDGGCYANPVLDVCEILRALSWVDPKIARESIPELKRMIRGDGSLPHSLDNSRPGILETSVFLQGASYQLMLAQDKKLTRSSYPMIKKLAQFLDASTADHTVASDSALPQGWRRHLGSGYPSGEIPEISLAVAAAFAAAAQVARSISKSDEAGKFRERSEMIAEQARKRLLDERGYPILCRDASGMIHNDESIDMAVAVYRMRLQSAAKGIAQRLLERDFDTPFGPRCIPTSNAVYFNGTYGKGELGGVRPRAVLAHAVVCFRAGLPGIGSLTLSKIAKLVTEDAPGLGGSTGAFPEWIDVDGHEVHGDRSDPVAAARFLEGIVEGELGLSFTADRATFSPPDTTALGWVAALDLWVGEKVSVFVGRSGGKAHLFFSAGKVGSAGGTRFAKSERIDLQSRGLFAATFYSPGQVICVGNSTQSQARVTVNFAPKAGDLSKRLSTPIETYDPGKGIWAKTGSLRVLPTMTFEAVVDPNGWKAFRVSNS
jgi:hypothetical protein